MQTLNNGAVHSGCVCAAAFGKQKGTDDKRERGGGGRKWSQDEISALRNLAAVLSGRALLPRAGLGLPWHTNPLFQTHLY